MIKISLKKSALPIPKKMYIHEPAHVSRYLITARLVKEILGSKANPKVLDVGGKKGLLREFGVQSTIIDQESSDEKDFIQGDALDMPFEDNSFDVVVSCDVLEHIPANKREQFIAEMTRVSKGFVVIGAPFDQQGVGESEKAANAFYKNIAKQDHRWLIEHIENGLPSLSRTEAYLKKSKLHYSYFRHLSLDIWDLTTQIHFLNAAYGSSKSIKKLAKNTYAEYYDQLCELDYSDTGYRTFFVINKNKGFALELPELKKSEDAKIAYKQFLNNDMLLSIKNLWLENESKALALEDSAKALDSQRDDIQKLKQEISSIKSSKSWKMATNISKAKNFYK